MISRIFELIQQKNITQRDLAKAVGVSTGNISDWKSGRSKPSFDVLARIAKYFGVSTDYLLGLTETKENPILVATVETGVYRWINDRAFTQRQSAILMDNFKEFLIRYKNVINHIANYTYSDAYQRLINSPDISREEMSMDIAQAVKLELNSLVRAAAVIPADLCQDLPAVQENPNWLLQSIRSIIGISMTGEDDLGLNEDERDLIMAWRTLDRSGKRIIMGKLEEQLQRNEKSTDDNSTVTA